MDKNKHGCKTGKNYLSIEEKQCFKQESIPVGCEPSAGVTVVGECTCLGGVYMPRGVYLPEGGVAAQGV